jgi:hypothetical protein
MVDDNPVLSYLGTCSFFPYPPRVGKIKNVFFGNPYQANRLVRFNNACCTMDFTFD